VGGTRRRGSRWRRREPTPQQIETTHYRKRFFPMGNFEKMAVLVIGVIIVMILVVALYAENDRTEQLSPLEQATSDLANAVKILNEEGARLKSEADPKRIEQLRKQALEIGKRIELLEKIRKMLSEEKEE